jgi:hypothetical protein
MSLNPKVSHAPQFTRPESVSLRKHSEFSEAWLHDRTCDDTSAIWMSSTESVSSIPVGDSTCCWRTPATRRPASEGDSDSAGAGRDAVCGLGGVMWLGKRSTKPHSAG